ncbi:hypothetical protein [Ciceribacter thiooxidans]|uniref:Transmembrane protein n=1 Tax=Ciceribacter thiooxidans TaxID=1969821 RepID=A0ABV7I2F2_9HYPH|nr:hypothetical protein [Ciceribacter thiooxidans]
MTGRHAIPVAKANQPEHIGKRIVLHFPGFEPLDAHKHRQRYERSLRKTTTVWGFSADAGPIRGPGSSRYFDVASQGATWCTSSRIHIFDHNDIVEQLNGRPLARRLALGFSSAARVVLGGGAFAYFRHAWRFGLFFVFPFLLVGLAMAASLVIAAYPQWLGLDPWHYPLAIVLAYAFFFSIFLPWSDRFHTLHLFSDWEMAVALARLDRPEVLAWLEDCAASVRAALSGEADEYVISSHSMGSSVAVHVLGMLLEREPELLKGKRVVFVTLGGAVLQCALLRPAEVLRARVGVIARTKEISWLDIQCLTDAVNFYRSKVVALAGHPDAPQAKIAFVRIKHMLSAERYRRIKRDLLRVHRQYVLDSDRRASFDFSLMTAGPLPAVSFANDIRAHMP